MFRWVQSRVVDSVSGMFAHAEMPLQHTGDFPGDPGLCGPDSVSWRVIGDVSVFVGGIRALLIQAAHPEVVAGVDEHSRYREDPLGRLSRTSFYVTSSTYGARPEVDEAIKLVRSAHQGVSGTSHRGRSYSASAPELAAWVHNTLTDSFLTAYQRFGGRLSTEEADRFVAEQTQVGALLGASPLPTTAGDLRDVDHRTSGPGPQSRDASRHRLLAESPHPGGAAHGLSAADAGGHHHHPPRPGGHFGAGRAPRCPTQQYHVGAGFAPPDEEQPGLAGRPGAMPRALRSPAVSRPTQRRRSLMAGVKPAPQP